MKLRESMSIVCAVIMALLIMFQHQSGATAENGTDTEIENEVTPYYATDEYRVMKDKQHVDEEAESRELIRRIERYRAEQESEAAQAFREAWEELGEDTSQSDSENAESEAETDTEQSFEETERDEMAEADGFVYYKIPDEYAREGGSFPLDIQKHTYRECADKRVDYSIVIAMIEQESGYRADLIDASDDTGYMQIIERHHRDVMEELGCYDLTDPCENITVGVAVFSELLAKYSGSYEKALTAYNCGCAGAYKYWFSAGVDASPYAKKVIEKAERIKEELK